jgi:GDSL-like lipase/acylhydrolase family protein
MRRAWILATALVLAASAAGAAGPKPAMVQLRDGDVVALCGDSITSAGSYPLFLELYHHVCGPKINVTFLNFGRWGETARSFPPVMDKSVIPAKPTVATICYGMNNCRSSRVMSDAAAKGWGDGEILTVVNKFKKAGVRSIVLSSPGCVDSTWFGLSQSKPPNQKAMEATQKNLSLLRDSARRVAAEHKLVFTDMHAAMIDVMAKAKAKHGKGYAFAGGKGDGVHPGAAGHLVMAWVFLKALGYTGEIGTVTLDLDKNKAEATGGHRVVAVKNGAVEVESVRYPFCFLGDPYKRSNMTGPRATRSVVELFPFNDDLNRFRLVVRGAKAKRLKVTWGKGAKEFDAATLEKGINLAAEFLDGNPFVKPFAKIATAMSERNRCRRWIRMPRYKDNPGMKKRLERAVASTKVVPVKHTILVTAVE